MRALDEKRLGVDDKAVARRVEAEKELDLVEVVPAKARVEANPRPRSGGTGQMSREEMIRQFQRRRGRRGFGGGGATGTYRVVVNADGETAETTFKISDAPKEEK